MAISHQSHKSLLDMLFQKSNNLEKGHFSLKQPILVSVLASRQSNYFQIEPRIAGNNII
jgi:hypothetical protein